MCTQKSMEEVRCYEPSSLITDVQKGVPFLTDAGDKSAELVLNLDEGTNEFYDHFVVIRSRMHI